MTAEELKDIALCGETTTIQFKQEFTGQKEIAKEMIAFANTRGGKMLKVMSPVCHQSCHQLN